MGIKQKLYPFGFRQDATKLASTTFVFVISYVLASWMIPTVSLIFIARLGQAELNGSALALTVYALVGNSIVVGLNFGCDTLFPQCFGGNKHKMGIILQRGIIIAFYACFIVWTLMLNAKYLLRWIEKDVEILTITNEFLQFFLLAAPLDALSLMLRMYIANTGRTAILIYMNLIGNIMNILSHYICIYYLHLGIHSAPISITIAYASIVFTAILYIRFSSIYEETWHPVTHACLQEWNMYLKLALPGVLAIAVECWSIELSEFYAANLSTNSFSAQVVVQQTVWLLYLITSSIGDAANILIGQYLGANKPMEAANAKNVTYTIGILIILFNIMIVLLSHRWLPYVFNIKTDALALARYGLLLGAVVNICDGLNAIQTSIVKACGMQRYACIILFISFLFIQLPLSYIFTFIMNMDIYGFWLAMILSEMLTDILLFVLIWRFDWNNFSEKALDNIRFTESEELNAHMELLPLKPIEHNDYPKIDKDISSAIASNESLFRSISIKGIILILLFCIFMVSFVNSIAENNPVILN